MNRLGTRSLMALTVAAVAATAAPAAAQVYKRTAADGTTYFTNVHPNPTAQRASYTQAVSRESQRPSSANYGIYSREIAEASARYGVPERLIWAVIRVESGFDARAVSPKGARGLMQLMPATAKRFGVKKIHDPEENIHGGVRYLAYLTMLFRDDLPRALAAYNAGENAVLKHGGIPPYNETRTYVDRAMTVYYGRPYGGGTTVFSGRRGGRKLRGGFGASPAPVLIPGAKYLGQVAAR